MVGQQAPLADILASELTRNFDTLKSKGEIPPYYMSYAVTDSDDYFLGARYGAIFARGKGRSRNLDLAVRLGDRNLDNYHVIEGNIPRFTAGVRIPLEDQPDAIKVTLWQETDRVYRAGIQRLSNLKSNKELKVKDTDPAPDFSQEKPSAKIENVPALNYDTNDWEGRVRRLSQTFSEYPRVLSSSVNLSFQRQMKTFVDTEGSRVQHGRTFVRLTVQASAKAVDGMTVGTNESFEAATPDKLPNEKDLLAAVRRVAEKTQQLATAPLVTPFVGPAILSGSASGVFFHEIFGHRVEGHRQKDITDGQTFAKSVGKPVLPDFLSVLSDPTRSTFANQHLFGSYSFDDEGVAAQPLTLVDKGVLKTFLMSRSPLSTIPNSNGHGRRQTGAEPVSRQSNLIVESSKRVPEADLRKLLIEEIKRQNKPFGLIFQQVTGGFTQTQRAGLAAFKVLPLVVYRVYADGRPDELVRGVDVVGTPLASFAKILATGDKYEVFNGYCGAESGSVPVSAAAPSILVSELEVQARQFSQDRPPILPNPLSGGTE